MSSGEDFFSFPSTFTGNNSILNRGVTTIGPGGFVSQNTPAVNLNIGTQETGTLGGINAVFGNNTNQSSKNPPAKPST